MARRAPTTLLLPTRMGEGAFCLRRLIASIRGWSWSEGYRLLEQFEMTGPERAFARELLRRKTNLWLFRTNQRRFVGDFVVVDMSASGMLPARRAWVLELKAGEAVRRAGGVQLQRWREAIDEIARTRGILPVGADASLLQGDPTLLLEALGATTPIPRRAQVCEATIGA